jgi:hypothetical protein
MSCFFPSIFKKSRVQKVKLILLGIVLALVLLLSGCKIARTVVAAPFKAVGWGAGKIGQVVAGEKKESEPKRYKLNPDGTLSKKNESDGSLSKENNVQINFKPLVTWSIIFVSIALVVRFLMNRHVYGSIKK